MKAMCHTKLHVAIFWGTVQLEVLKDLAFHLEQPLFFPHFPFHQLLDTILEVSPILSFQTTIFTKRSFEQLLQRRRAIKKTFTKSRIISFRTPIFEEPLLHRFLYAVQLFLLSSL